ncbi:DMT family transporter [Pollutimonas bauzanensis]|uniref:Threonine/homoserine efflux transporter RhtA n=1 Tax=Pollutimonas bauzanensis TaxID=658167 RepID=A0A1M5MR40_9BURK|nr:DMT family transporter [Pollutimonas bauzanensis]SHG79677.1 Threonine/homoserine efflux transporter RhtA [Pollutimonas bauzanensis]
MSTTTLAPSASYQRFFWPALFILMWSSGYVAGKIGLPYAGPFTLIFIRFASAAIILLAVTLATQAPWPTKPMVYVHLAVVGLLVQALQFSGLYLGLSLGVSAGVSALVVGMMPIFTAIGAIAFLNERVTSKQVLGLMIGLFGVTIVVLDKIGVGQAQWAGYAAVLVALLGISAGTLYQKKFVTNIDLRTAGFIQLTIASLAVAPIAIGSEHLAIIWTPELIGASVWLSLVNSIGAVSVLFLLMRRGEATKVAGLFYLIPSATAIMGYVVLGETLTALQLFGFFISATGVYLTTRR